MSYPTSFNLNFKNIIPTSYGKRAYSTLFLVAALVVVAAFIAPMVSRAGVPTFSSGGPGNGQVGTPPDALIDIYASEALSEGTVIAGDNNVSLKKCTGATDALSCTPTGSDDTTNLCTQVALGQNVRIICGVTVPLAINTTYRFR
ncbi:MAG: hypothetical protein Q7S48_01740, partial [bacterium]|nr:hypothetical protein [bacterium]